MKDLKIKITPIATFNAQKITPGMLAQLHGGDKVRKSTEYTSCADKCGDVIYDH